MILVLGQKMFKFNFSDLKQNKYQILKVYTNQCRSVQSRPCPDQTKNWRLYKTVYPFRPNQTRFFVTNPTRPSADRICSFLINWPTFDQSMSAKYVECNFCLIISIICKQCIKWGMKTKLQLMCMLYNCTCIYIYIMYIVSKYSFIH